MPDTETKTVLPHAIAQQSLALAQQLSPVLRSYSMSETEWLTLTALGAMVEAEGVTVTPLAKLCGAQQPTMTKALNRLRERGLIERRDDEKDGRLVHVSLTDAGAQVAKSLVEDWKLRKARETREGGS